MANVLWRDHRVGTVGADNTVITDKENIAKVAAKITAIRIDSDYTIKQIVELDIKFDPGFCELFGIKGVDTE